MEKLMVPQEPWRNEAPIEDGEVLDFPGTLRTGTLGVFPSNTHALNLTA